MRAISHIFRGLLIAALFAGALHAQPASQQWPTLKPVDPGVADMGPLSTSGRIMSKDVRQPSGFDRVYEVEMNGQKYFARVNGGMIAVFPRSAYTSRNGGLMPIVPAGTTFYLGKLPDNAQLIDSGQSTSVNSAVRSAVMSDGARPFDNSVNFSASAALPAQSSAVVGANAAVVDVSPPTANLWESETYRAGRIAELLGVARKSRAGRTNFSAQ